jgi:two-component system sensor histidine kinase HydH
VALLLAAAFLWRLLGQREAVERGLEHERRLAALGEMSAVMAHEIRNPLASLKGHTQLLTELLAPESRERAKAELVLDEALRLERLTTDLLDFVRPQDVARTQAVPAELVRSAVAQMDHPAMEFDDAGASETWSLDGPRMQRALLNLLRNAVQASPQRPVRVFLRREAGHLVLLVRDEGPGIAPGEETAIFEPFKTTRVRGTGLGLAIARGIVEAHGGSISARNHPDGGAEFRVTIPPA